jgi:hypothetical protein
MDDTKSQFLKPDPAAFPPTQETTALAVEECVTPDRISVSDDCVMLRRISLIGG